TVSTALEKGVVTPDTLINCNFGLINLRGRVIHDEHKYGIMSVADVIAKSSNIGAIQIGLRVGEQGLYEYIRKFGFGQKTGIELPGESAGILRPVKEWTVTSIGSIPMGHEVGITSLQMAVAGAIVANGGLMVKPRLVLARQRPGEPLETYAP